MYILAVSRTPAKSLVHYRFWSQTWERALTGTISARQCKHAQMRLRKNGQFFNNLLIVFRFVSYLARNLNLRHACNLNSTENLKKYCHSKKANPVSVLMLVNYNVYREFLSVKVTNHSSDSQMLSGLGSCKIIFLGQRIVDTFVCIEKDNPDSTNTCRIQLSN